MDLRDAMSVDPNRIPTAGARLQTAIETFYEKKFYANADAIISVSDPIINSIRTRHYCPDLNSKTYTIYNGFDDDDFKDIRPIERIDNIFSITYTGSFMGRRSPEFFLEAVRSLADQKDIKPSDILLRFVGHFNDQTLGLFQKFKPHFPLEVLGFQPYKDTLKYQANSSLLLLIVNVEEEEGGSQIMTGKFFEYLGANRPILALVPSGDLKNLIIKGRFGVTARQKDVMIIADTLKKLYNEWKSIGTIKYNPDKNIKNSFTRRYLTGRLAKIIDNLT